MTIKYDAGLLIKSIADQLKTQIDPSQIHLIGIQTGGVLVAQQIAKLIKYSGEVSQLNISFYRDDFTNIGLHPEVKPSNLHHPIDQKTVVLVDDVLHTGRTIRAALNEIFDYGRPAKVILVILVDRNNHELPITPDICGVAVKLKPNQEIKLSQQTIQTGLTLKLEVIEIG